MNPTEQQGLDTLAQLAGSIAQVGQAGNSSQRNNGVAPGSINPSAVLYPHGMVSRPNQESRNGMFDLSSSPSLAAILAAYQQAGGCGNGVPQQQQLASSHHPGDARAYYRAAQAAQLAQYVMQQQQQANQMQLFAAAANAGRTGAPAGGDHRGLVNQAQPYSAVPQRLVDDASDSPKDPIPHEGVAYMALSKSTLQSSSEKHSGGLDRSPPSLADTNIQVTTPRAASLRRNASIARAQDDELSASSFSEVVSTKRREMKRAANRRSAQLSRKRKKEFMHDMYEELDDLRHKERILMSVPDVVVAFDSAGRFTFVSPSVKTMLGYDSGLLSGASFWKILTDDSAKLLKGSFMDALAIRSSGIETTSLGEGMLRVEMIRDSGDVQSVILNGAVHFSGDAPECVCNIRLELDRCSVNESQSAMKKPFIYSHSHHRSSMSGRENGDIRKIVDNGEKKEKPLNVVG